MKVLFFVKALNHPATRYRVLQYLDYLKEKGITYEVMQIPKGMSAGIKIYKKSKGQDIVFFQKKRISSIWIRMIKSTGANVVYDFDDAVMFSSPRKKNYFSKTRMKRFINMVKNVDCVVSGNEYLKNIALEYNKNVFKLPTSIDLKKYNCKDDWSLKEKIKIGWIGGRKSLYYLEDIHKPLAELCKNNARVVFNIVSSDTVKWDDVRIEHKKWSTQTEVEDVMDFDIGVSPLKDDVWTRGKCGTKLLQCMACGVPVVASPYGVHNEILKNGEFGLLASSDNEWIDMIQKLIHDQRLRTTCGLRARQRVEEEYSVEVNQKKLVEILEFARNL